MNYKKGTQQLNKEVERFNSIVKLKKQGYINKEISEILNISEPTINNTYKKYANNFSEQIVEMKLDPQDVKHAWVKNDSISAFLVNPLFSKKEDIEKLSEELLKDIKKYSYKVPKIKRDKVKDEHLLEIDIADAHFGKLSVKSETGVEYNLEIAKQRFKESVEVLVDRAIKAFNIDKIVFIIGNDVLHVDNDKKTTTRGTPQDTDKMWHEAFITARDSYIWAIEYLTQIADVDIIYNPSNHDYISGYMLAQTTAAWFNNNKNVSFDITLLDRKYYKYGENMIMYTHADKAKEKDFSILMATESPQMWADTKYRYISGHHLHHHRSKEYIGATMKSKRSISSADSWHYKNGYVSLAGADAEVYSKTKGKVAEFTYYVE